MISFSFNSSSNSPHIFINLSLNLYQTPLFTPPLGHDDKCRTCKLTGNMILCDFCPDVYHLTCLNPALQQAPEGDWKCPRCEVGILSWSHGGLIENNRFYVHLCQVLKDDYVISIQILDILNLLRF